MSLAQERYLRHRIAGGSTRPRRPVLLALVLIAVALFAIPAPFASAGAKSKAKDPTLEWVDGPVRYLMTRAERRRFSELNNTADRLAFIRQFWQRRDTDPRTPVNEARAVFWQRVTDANRQFGSPGTPGWRSDRGKIYILLGPPEDVQTKENYDTGARDVANRGLMRWSYRGLASATNRAHMIIAFVRGNDDDWHLTDDARLNSPYFDANSALSEQVFNGTSLLFDQLPYADSNLSTMMDLGRVQEVPTESEILRTVVNAEGFLGAFATQLDVAELSRPDGTRVLWLTLALRRAEIAPAWDGTTASLASRFAVSCTLHRAGASGAAPVEVPEEDFTPEPSPIEGDAWVRFGAVAPLPAGPVARAWDVGCVALDRLGGGAGTAHVPFEAATAADGAPLVNGPVLAALLTKQTDVVPGGTRPFRFGEAVVVPRTERRLGPKDPFALFIEILPPPGADAPVALDWRFERTEPGATAAAPWGRPGHLDDARGPRAWQLDAGTLPPGRYTVRFTATANGLVAERTIEFEASPTP